MAPIPQVQLSGPPNRGTRAWRPRPRRRASPRPAASGSAPARAGPADARRAQHQAREHGRERQQHRHRRAAGDRDPAQVGERPRQPEPERDHPRHEHRRHEEPAALGGVVHTAAPARSPRRRPRRSASPAGRSRAGPPAPSPVRLSTMSACARASPPAPPAPRGSSPPPCSPACRRSATGDPAAPSGSSYANLITRRRVTSSSTAHSRNPLVSCRPARRTPAAAPAGPRAPRPPRRPSSASSGPAASMRSIRSLASKSTPRPRRRGRAPGTAAHARSAAPRRSAAAAARLVLAAQVEVHERALGQHRQRHDPLALGQPQVLAVLGGTVKSTDTSRRTCSCESTLIVSTRRCRHAAWRVSSAAKPTAISPARSSRTSPGQGCTQRALQRVRLPAAFPADALDEDRGRLQRPRVLRRCGCRHTSVHVALVHHVLHQLVTSRPIWPA